MQTVTTTMNGVPERSLRNDLAYNEMTMGANGSVMNREEKRELRIKYGYCTECEGLPTLLYNIKKNRLNPLWVTKDPRAVAGECSDGVCFVCHPDQDPQRKFRGGRGQRPNFASRNNQNQRSTARMNASPMRPQNNAVPSHPPFEPPFPAATVTGASAATTSTTSTASSPGAARRPSGNRVGGGQDPRVRPTPASPRPGRSNSKQRSKSSFPAVFVPDVMLVAQCELANSERSHQSQGSSSIDNSQRNNNSSTALSASAEELPTVSEHSAHSNQSDRQRPRPPPSPRSPRADTGRPNMAPRESSFSSSHSHSQTELSQHSLGAAPAAAAGTPHPASTTTSNLSEQELDSIIDGIDSLVQSMINIPGNSDVLSSIIMGTMNEHGNVPAVQTYCLRMIWDTCKDSDENKEALMVAGAPAKILEAMRSFPDSPSVQEKGCGAIWSLGVNSSNRVVLIRARACQQVSLAIKSFMSTESLVRTAIGALRTLSPESEARDLLCSLGGPKFVSKAMSMHRGCVSIQRDGCAFLSNCAVDIEKQVVKVVPFEELDAVVQAMETHRNELSVMQGACFALKNYTHEETNCRAVRSCKGIMPLMEYAATYEASPSCMENAADILERLQMSRIMDESIEEQAYMELIRFSDSVGNKQEVQRRILDFMNDFVWSPRMTSAAIEILRKMITEDAAQGDYLFTSGTIRDIFRFCQDLSRDESVCAEGCGLVACLSYNDVNHDALLDVGTHSFIFKSLGHTSNVDVVKNALEALTLLCGNDRWFQEIKQQMSLISEAHNSHPTNDSVQMSYMSILSMMER